MRKLQKFKALYQEFNPLQARQTDIVALRGAIYNQKGCPLAHWIIGKLYAKTSKDDKLKILISALETESQALWLLEVMCVIKMDLLGLIGS